MYHSKFETERNELATEKVTFAHQDRGLYSSYHNVHVALACCRDPDYGEKDRNSKDPSSRGALFAFLLPSFLLASTQPSENGAFAAMDRLLGRSSLGVCPRARRASQPGCGRPARHDHVRDEDDLQGEIAYRTQAGTGSHADAVLHATRGQRAGGRKPWHLRSSGSRSRSEPPPRSSFPTRRSRLPSPPAPTSSRRCFSTRSRPRSSRSSESAF